MDWFQLWENISKMWTFLYRSFHECVFISLGKISRSEIVGLCSKHMLNFIRIQLVLKTFVPFYIPTGNTRAYRLSLQICQQLEWKSHSSGCRVVSHCGLFYIYLMTNALSILPVPFGEHYLWSVCSRFPILIG